MDYPLQFENFTIEKVDLDLQVNFIVSDAEGYVCRLVPGEAGLEVSQQDKELDNIPNYNFLIRLSDFILRNDA